MSSPKGSWIAGEHEAIIAYLDRLWSDDGSELHVEWRTAEARAEGRDVVDRSWADCGGERTIHRTKAEIEAERLERWKRDCKRANEIRREQGLPEIRFAAHPPT